MGSDSRICREVLDVSRRISRWLYRQPAVGEESITDWMLYEVSERLPFAVYVKFSRIKEAKDSGADWDWWFVSRNLSLGLRIQAKRLSRNSDHYAALAYTNQYGLQIEKLIESSKEMNLLPFYALYHATATSPPLRCDQAGKTAKHEGVFLSSAAELHARFINGPRATVGATDLLSITTPLSGMFCCDNMRQLPASPVESIYGYTSVRFICCLPTVSPALTVVSGDSGVSTI